MRRALVVVLSAAALVVAPLPARANITGPCTGTLAGADVKAGHGEPGTAIKIPHDATVSVGGGVAGRATAVRYAIELAGIERSVPVTIRTGQKSSSWSGQVEISKYTWATVGLFKVVGAASTSAGRCSGFFYVCITGKSPVTTAAGATGLAAFVGGLILLAVTIARVKNQAAGIAAMKAFFPAAIMAAGGALLLQQSCVMPLDVTTAGIIPIAVGIGGGALAPIVGGIIGVKPPPGGYTPARPASSAPAPSPDEAPHVNLRGPAAINTLIAAGATPVPGTIYVLPPTRDLPGILGTTFTTKKIPDPANPGQTIDVIDPAGVIVLAQPGAIPAPADMPSEPTTTPPGPPAVGPTPPADPADATTTTPTETPTTTTPLTPPTTTTTTTMTPATPTASPDSAPPVPAPTATAPAGPLNSETIVKTLTQPGGGTITIPPGNIGPMMPPGLVDGDGKLQIPPKVSVPGEVRKMFDDKPPPSMSISEDGKLQVEPPKQTSIAGRVVEALGTWVTVELAKDAAGKLTGKATLMSAAGMIETDITSHAKTGFDAINKGLQDKKVRIKTLKIDPKAGITITTEPIPQ